VLEALAALRAADREVLMLVCWEGLDSARAARVLGTTSVAVRLRLHRARRRLSQLLTEDPKEDLYAIAR
jgi:RNA polymerase sigma-70 factor, ECF subfamily